MIDRYIEFELEDRVYVYELAGFWERVIARVIDVPFFIISFGIAFVFGPWIYRSIMQSSYREATIGQMAMGLKVVDIYGDRINFLKASSRYWYQILNFLTFGIGVYIMLFNKNSQTIPDMISDTVVIKGDAVEVFSCDEYYAEETQILKEPVYRERNIV